MRPPLRLLLCLSFCLLLAACAAGDAGSRARQPQTGAVEVPAPGAMMLPAPSVFKPQPAAFGRRGVSYLPSDLVRKGSQFSAAYAHPLAAANADACDFSPAGTASGGFTGCAYALFEYSIAGYGGPARLLDSWSTPPAAGSAWIGLANWNRDRWDWYPASGSGSAVPVASLSPYFTFNGGLLACVLVTGGTPCALTRLRVGGVAPSAVLTATPQYGRPPLSTTLDAGASTDPDGSIARYQWDLDGDGSFELDGGATPTLPHDFIAAGSYEPAVRVTDGDGLYADASTTVQLVDTAIHSIGGPTQDEGAFNVVPLPNGDVALLGYHGNLEAHTDSHYCRIHADGSAPLARSVSVGYSSILLDSAADAQGNAYGVGRHQVNNLGQIDYDGLVEKWDSAGNLVWCRSFGSTQYAEEVHCVAISGGFAFVAGTTRALSVVDIHPFVACFDLDGNLIWARSLALSSGELNDIAYTDTIDFQGTALRACGDYSDATAEQRSFFCAFDSSGGLNSVSQLNLTPSRAEHIAVGSDLHLPPVYISGSYQPGTTSVYVSRVGGTCAILDQPNAVYEHSAGLVLSGGQLFTLLQRSQQFGTAPDAALAILSSDLATVSGSTMYSQPDGEVYARGMARYGSGVVVCGATRLMLPQAQTASPGLSSVSATWDTISPAVSDVTDWSTANPAFTLTEVDGYSLDREASDNDIAFGILP